LKTDVVPDRKVIGRILSLGFPLPGPLVDNYNFLSAPSFFDYDALVIDPAALARLIDGVVAGTMGASTFADAAVRNDAAADDAVRLAAILERRRAETAKLLENGGLVVCFLHADATLHNIDGAGDVGLYDWLPPGTLPVGSIRPGDGTQADVVDYQHPLAAFVHRQLADVTYRAFVDVDAWPGFASSAGHVFARSKGGAPIGVEIPVDALGRLVLLPAMKPAAGDERYIMSNELQAGIRRTLGAEAPGREPPWLASFSLPGLADLHNALEAARATQDAAQSTLDGAQRAHDELARYRRLLWQEGAVGLNEAVLDALRLIGIDVYPQDQNALELRIDGRTALLEIEASVEAIDLAPHYRLRQRIERAIDQRADVPRGILVVNGRRLARPSERVDEVTGALRLAAATMRYCVAPTSTLFDAVAAHLDGDASAVAAYRSSLVTHEGMLGDQP
jgi:hypothetical protein